MWKGVMMTHIRYLAGLVLGLALVGCTMDDSGQSNGKRPNVELDEAAALVEQTLPETTTETTTATTIDESQGLLGAVVLAAHHHHKRGSNCEHGKWATTQDAGHHHHKRGHNCGHGLWATDSVGGHHHHKRGDDCEHHQWATSDPFADTRVTGLDEIITEETFSDDPSVPYDLSNSDQRSYAEIEAEPARMEQVE
jgi:hypothetical protein